MLRLHDHMVPGSILPWAPPFGKREDSCKPPQGERLYPCAWFQVQDPSAARLDLAHVSLVSADDILRIRRVSTLVSPTVELSTPRKPTGRVTPMRQAKQCKVTYDGGYPTGPPRRPRDWSHPWNMQNRAKIPTMVHMIPTFVLRSFHLETAPRPDTPHGQRHDPFLSRCE